MALKDIFQHHLFFSFVTVHTKAASALRNRRNMQNGRFCFKTFSTIVWF